MMLEALQYALDHGAPVVTAAGNDGRQITSGNFISPVGYAKDLAGVIAVGSFDAHDRTRSSFSNSNGLSTCASAP